MEGLAKMGVRGFYDTVLPELMKPTIANLRGAEFQITRYGTKERPFWSFIQLTGTMYEQALMFTDGWIALVRVEPYRVEWRTPDGQWRPGPEVPWEWPRADAREKAAAVERHKRRYGDRNLKQLADDPWADRLAPIRGGALLGISIIERAFDGLIT